MFILTLSIGDGPFLPQPPYDPKTGKPLLGIWQPRESIVRPRIKKYDEVRVEDILKLLEKRNNDELVGIISTLSDEEIAQLFREFEKKIKK